MLAVAPATSEGASPRRRKDSLRRTATIETHWPDGIGGPLAIIGRARDLVTRADDQGLVIVAEDQVETLIDPLRRIEAIAASRNNTVLQALVGLRVGGPIRKAMAALLPEEGASGTPLNLIIDDLAGASLVAPWAWSVWMKDWRSRITASDSETRATVDMTGVCAGFRPGSSALGPGGRVAGPQSSAIVVALPRDDDPIGWHEMTDQRGPGHRRARRIDLWLAGGSIHVDAGFQDSVVVPESTTLRRAVHEYRVTAMIDRAELTVQSIAVRPAVLPYPECPAASANVDRVVGRSLRDFRLAVPTMLPGVDGCTHLTDILRSLQDVPAMAEALAAHSNKAG